MQKIYKAEEIAKKLNISYRKVLELIKEGKLDCLDMGKKRITQDQFDKYLRGENENNCK